MTTTRRRVSRAVAPETLSTPERDLSLEDRGAAPAEKEASRDELAELRGRIAQAKKTTPRDRVPHCADSFRRGWQAALRAVEADGGLDE